VPPPRFSLWRWVMKLHSPLDLLVVCAFAAAIVLAIALTSAPLDRSLREGQSAHVSRAP